MAVYSMITCGDELRREFRDMGRDYYSNGFYSALYEFLEELPEDFVVDVFALLGDLEEHEFENLDDADEFANDCDSAFMYQEGLTVHTLG